jgi:hypothetical protein
MFRRQHFVQHVALRGGLFGEMNVLYIKESATYVVKTLSDCIQKKHHFPYIAMSVGMETIGIL